jgi:probable F420-dependent oxidoreductase
MKVDATIAFGGAMEQFIDECKSADRLFDGIAVGEANREPFLPLMMAAEHTRRVRLETSVAIAFARSPMILAQIAYDLHQYSGGRFSLGLGTQIRPHIERRFSMPWSAPAARMREMVLAIRAIWASWHDGADLDFRGEFYTHTLMIPFFSPGRNPYGLPPIALAAVGPRMTEVAGEVSDAVLLHPLMSEQYLRSITIPALERGLSNAGRERSDVDVCASVFIVTGKNEDERRAAAQYVKQRIAFYGSTPAYRAVFDLHGWGSAHEQLHRLSKQGAWPAMSELVSDKMLETFAIIAEPEAVAAALLARFGDVYDRVSFYAPNLEFALLAAPVLQALSRPAGTQPSSGLAVAD